jgi:hypothetical protein
LRYGCQQVDHVSAAAGRAAANARSGETPPPLPNAMSKAAPMTDARHLDSAAAAERVSREPLVWRLFQRGVRAPRSQACLGNKQAGDNIVTILAGRPSFESSPTPVNTLQPQAATTVVLGGIENVRHPIEMRFGSVPAAE